MFRYVPEGMTAGLTSYDTPNDSVVSPKFQPALKAETFAAAMVGLVANFFSRKRIVPSVGRLYIQLSRPSANMFLARPASLRDRPEFSRAPRVRPVRSIE